MKFIFDVTIEATDEAYVSTVRAAVAQLLKEWQVPFKTGPVRTSDAITADMVVIHTDGGCDSKRDGIGAWACMIEDMQEGIEQMLTGAMLWTTNNRMEMMAAIKALETVEIGRPVRLVTDSEYLIKGCLEWLRSWKRRNWITASGTKVMNRDLWERLDELVQVHTIEFQHIKGHTGHKQNELCDNACTQAMNAAWNGPQDLIPVDHNSPNAPAAA